MMASVTSTSLFVTSPGLGVSKSERLRVFKRIIIIGTVLSSCAISYAQLLSPAIPSTSSIAPSAGDEAWAALVNDVSAETSVPPGGSQAQGSKLSITSTSATSLPTSPKTWRAKADLAQTFYQKYPDHAKTAEAQKIEAIMLLHAVFEGDASLVKRKNETANAFIVNPAVAEHLRAEVAGLQGFLDVMGANPQPNQLWSDLEKMARQLIKNFPKQPQGYDTLFTVASSIDDKRSKQIATELMAMEAPLGVKKQAQTLLSQLALIGKPLDILLVSAKATKLKSGLKTGKATIIFSWANNSPESIKLGELLAKRALGKANVIGVNVDNSPVAAASRATLASSPGVLADTEAGISSRVATSLNIADSSTIYFVNTRGTIVDVRGSDDLEQKLAVYGL